MSLPIQKNPARQFSTNNQSLPSQFFKIILVGDVGTGKTSFLTQLIHRVPQRLPKPTTFLSVFSMRISKPAAMVQIWDSPGDSKYYFQTLGQIHKFNAVLIFIDVTNQYTYERARIIADQVAMYASMNNIAMHLIQSKIQQVIKDPLKRKVTRPMLHRISDKFNGGIFQYNQNTSVEPIIQDILQWKNKSVQLLKAQKQRQQLENVSSFREIKFQKEADSTNCQCAIF